MSQIHRDLALHMDRRYLQNRGQLLRLTWLFRLASVLLVVEVVAWVVDLLVQAEALPMANDPSPAALSRHRRPSRSPSDQAR
jgi:hypothetical protein